MPQSSKSGTRVAATFCFVDVAGFTALTEVHGDEAAADLVDRLTALIGVTLEECTDATLLEVVGDAALIMCSEPATAVRFITTLFERAVKERNFPVLRAGLHAGHVLPRNGRYLGTTLNTAARVAARARGGQVLCTSGVAQAAEQQGLAVRSLGVHELRNIRQPVELFELMPQARAADVVVDPVCRMRVEPDSAAGTLRHQGQTFWFCSLRCAQTFTENPDAFLAR